MPSVNTKDKTDVLVVKTRTLDGDPEASDAQSLSLAVQVGGTKEAADMATVGVNEEGDKVRLPTITIDETPTYVPIAPGGQTVAAGAEVELIPALSGRVKVRVNHRGIAGGDKTLGGDAWIGWGQTASGDVPGAEVGDWIEPGGLVEEIFAGAVHVRNTGDDPIRLTWMEWGA